MSINPINNDATYLRYLDVSKQLDNGITYFVKRSESGAVHTATIHVAVKVGSFDEKPHQRGLAHFLEHVAFLGTEKFDAREIKAYFDSNGVRFGADLNAITSPTSTIYKIQTPTSDPKVIEKRN